MVFVLHKRWFGLLVVAWVINATAGTGKRCEPSQFKCEKTEKCINRQFVRNEIASCGDDDNSDEVIPPFQRCNPQSEFRCRGSGQCIPRLLVNVATAGCHDYSDKDKIANFPCNPNTEFRCKAGNCIPRHRVNNRMKDCTDGSDEDIPGGLECHPAIEFKCSVGGRCLRRHQVQDKWEDCPDGEDEAVTFRNHSCAPSSGEFQCVSGRCIPRWKVGDGIADCHRLLNDSEDEIAGAVTQCNASTEFQCGEGNATDRPAQCIPKSWVNDGLQHCQDGSDEQVASLNCTSDEWACDGGKRCILPQNLCDGIPDCDDCSDETDHKVCSKSQASRFFQCSTPIGLGDTWSSGGIRRSHCVYRSYFCDGVVDCADGSDEMKAGEGLKCRVTNAKAGKPMVCVLPPQLVQDGIVDCDDASDESNLPASTTHCLSSASGDENATAILTTQLCDGVFDCKDLTDECLCHVMRGGEAERVCGNVCHHGDAERCGDCRAGFLRCEVRGSDGCVPISSICDGTPDCSDGSDEMACNTETHPLISDRGDGLPYICPMTPRIRFLAGLYREIPRNATRCDGIPECVNLYDECANITDDLRCSHVKEVPPYCEHLKDNWHCDNDTKVLPPKYICDGVKDCEDGIDEKYCQHARFYCDVAASSPDGGKQVSIRNSQVCDGFPDCNDWMDERNCSNHFYCRDQLPPYFVDLKQVLDGVQDCEDRSDECPNDQAFANDPLSSRDQMIKHGPLKAWMLLMAIVAIVGNVCVIFSSVMKIVKSRLNNDTKKCCSRIRDGKSSVLAVGRPASSLAKCNDILVLNLAAADLLTGFYLLFIAIRSHGYSGSYCLHQLSWRSSEMCNSLGVLVLTSCQASIGMMVILTTYRLYAVVKPWSVTKLRIRVVIGLIAITWAIAICWGILPTAPMFKDAFVSSSIISNKDRQKGALYFHDLSVSKRQLGNFVRKLCVLAYSKQEVGEICNATGTNPDWDELRQVAEHLIPGLLTGKQIGYYGAHGVCLPTFYHSSTTGGTLYTVLLMAFNFVAFAYIAIAYAIVWHKSSSSQVSKGENSDGQVKLRSASAKRVCEMHRRIFRLIITDFICWIPVCVMSFCGIAGVNLPPMVYSLTAALLIPINSALNPVLYSDVIQKVARVAVRKARFVITGSATHRKGSFPFSSERSNSVSNMRRISLKPDQINCSTPQAHSTTLSSSSLRERLRTLVAPSPRQSREMKVMRTQMSEIETSHVLTRHAVAPNQHPAPTEALIKKTTTL